ncbi:hypothetical protein EP7_002172 [Isosphaeraceae bacterium EP7]
MDAFDGRAILAILAMLCGWPSDVAARDVSLEEVIEAVREKERLYRDVEVKSKYSYVAEQPEDQYVKQALRSYTTASRSVSQGDLYYFREAGARTTFEGAKGHDLDEIAGYDGKVTRFNHNGEYANIYHGRAESQTFYRPHMLPFRQSVGAPLSLYLRGGKELSKHPLSGPYHERAILTVKLDGHEAVDGIECLKIRCESRYRERPEDPGSLGLLWLAPSRNYLPLKFESYAVDYSSTLPMVSGRVEELREFSPGAWYPSRYKDLVYDRASLREGKHILIRSDTIEVESVAPTGTYPVTFFGDVPIPDGLPVYEIEGEKIVKSYIQGEAPDAK